MRSYIKCRLPTAKKKEYGEWEKKYQETEISDLDIVSSFYEILVVHFGIPPSEFRTMTVDEAMFYVESKTKALNQGRLNDEQIDHLKKRMAELEAEGVNVI